MRVTVCRTAGEAGARAADLIAERLRAAITQRGKASVALSGGHTPATMMQALASAQLDWPAIHLYQVDERIVGSDDRRRNLIGIRGAFAQSRIPVDNIHDMPVESLPPDAGAARYQRELCTTAGTPPHIDVVHLGLGTDGHTASLVADDDVLDAADDVAITGPYQGVRRMTLTLPALNRARYRIWLVTGASKQHVVRRFLDADPALVASRVRRDAAVVVLDRGAAGE